MKKVTVLFSLVFGIGWASSVSAEESSGGVQTYTVQWGDRLERVAARYGLTGEELLAANPRSAYGVKCKKPSTVERNGQRQSICGGDEPYLVAEKTLIIPEPRILIQAENGALRAELAALRAEMEELEEKYEAEKFDLAEMQQERDDLTSKLDYLRDENKGLVEARAEASGQHDQLRTDLDAVLSHQPKPKQVEVRVTNATHIILAVAITAIFAILVIMFVSYRKGKKFNHLVQIVQPSLIAQAEKNKKRGTELDLRAKELDRQAREQDDLGTKLGDEKAKQDKQDKDLAAREATQKQGETDLDAAKKAVTERETSCTRREGEIKEAERQLLERSSAFSMHVREEEDRLGKLRGELNVKRARLDGQAATQEEKEKKLADLHGALGQGAARLRAEQAEFANQRGAVAGAMRCLDEDVPALETRIREVQDREEAVAGRESKVGDDEVVLKGRTRTVEQHEEELRRGEGELARKQDALREAQGELARYKAELEDRARGLSDWEDRLRKTGEAKVTSEDGVDDGDDDPTSVALPPLPEDPRDVTHIDPPGSEPVMDVSKVLCPDCGNEVPFGRLDEHRAAAHGVGAGEKSRGPETCAREDGREVALTSPEAHLGTCSPADITCGVCRRSFADRREFDDHRTGCPEAVPHTPTIQGPSAATSGMSNPHETGPHIPVAAEPSHEESGFYCNVCHQSFSAEEYERDHLGHNTGLPKPE